METEDIAKCDFNPWRPITDSAPLRRLGKFGEELAECSAAVSRCIIQGIDESEPVTGKVNRQWLENEIADVMANIETVIDFFQLDTVAMYRRARLKKDVLIKWNTAVDNEAKQESKSG